MPKLNVNSHQKSLSLLLRSGRNDGLDVPVEVTGMAECLVAILTLMNPFTKMNSFDMLLEVTGSRE